MEGRGWAPTVSRPAPTRHEEGAVPPDVSVPGSSETEPNVAGSLCHLQAPGVVHGVGRGVGSGKGLE
jgi:hypothetical protein